MRTLIAPEHTYKQFIVKIIFLIYQTMKVISSSERLFIKNNWNDEDQCNWFEQNSKLKGSAKGDHLEELTREYLEYCGVNITLSKARKWLPANSINNNQDQYALQIFGDNGLDLFGWTKINGIQRPVIVQCKCYDTVGTLSTTEALSLDALTGYFGPNAMGIYIVKNQNSVNNHFDKVIQNSTNCINWFDVKRFNQISEWFCTLSTESNLQQIDKAISINKVNPGEYTLENVNISATGILEGVNIKIYK
jgi:hypothetical protein